MNNLDQLKKFTTIAIDSGEIEAIKNFAPTDATTNPSLILAAAKLENYDHIVKRSRQCSKSNEDFKDMLLVSFGCEILEAIPGRVSSEIDPKLSFDTKKSIEKARRIIRLYENYGIDRSRVLIKIAATWEGIKAGEILEKEGIACNLTLVFSLVQAKACAESGITLISPFVGRVLDWYKKNAEEKELEYHPGVAFVKDVYRVYKCREYKTQIMGASFRSVDEINALAGLDLLTISPQLLKILQDDCNKVVDPEILRFNCHKIVGGNFIDKSTFRCKLNKNKMATDNLSEGIRKFCKDSSVLDALYEQ